MSRATQNPQFPVPSANDTCVADGFKMHGGWPGWTGVQSLGFGLHCRALGLGSIVFGGGF